MSSECSFNKCYYNEHTYYQFKKLDGVKIYDVKGICDEFIERMEAWRKRTGIKRGVKKPVGGAAPLTSDKGPMDMEYLEMIERDYCHFKNLNLQLMASQENTRHYHYRIYWSLTSYEENCLWLELNYKKIISIFEEFKPDIILDMDNAELQRTVLAEVAYAYKVPCMTIEYSKFGYYKYPSFQNSYGIDPYIRRLYEENLARDDSELSEAIAYIEKYRAENSIMNQEFAGSVTNKYERDSLIWIARVMRGKWNYFWNQDITAGNLKRKKKSRMLYAPSRPYLRHYLETELNKRMLYGKNRYFEDPVEGEPYVYMPLHLIPESSVFVKASYYVDEANLIEQVSKSLPIGWKLYVKEHQAMLGERALSFYEKVAQLHNVRVVQVNYYKDPKPWILNAKGIVTITGTAAYEAALLGKRSIVFGEVPFSLIEGITRVTDFSELPGVIKQFDNEVKDNELRSMTHSAAAYIETVKQAGEPVKIFELMDGAEEIFAGRAERTPEFEKELDVLVDFFEKGYERWKNDVKD
ncbi:MAG: hypothetical protein IKR68_02255 [Lachnospiraceae bacterium]|nr:hypothetical protein [Lachnospiraceae bacterium]